MSTKRPTQSPPVSVRPGAQAWSGGSGDVGVLLCHGFTGSPASMRPWAEDLVARGYRVEVPRLPGHGTSWQEMNTTDWRQWYGCIEEAFDQLHSQCRTVFVAGLSMGGALALLLAQRRGEKVAGMMLVNPAVSLKNPLLVALPVMKRFVPSLKAIGGDIARVGADELAYDRTPLRALDSMLDLFAQVRAALPNVRQPLLLFRSVQDHVVDATSAQIILSSVSTTDIRAFMLPRSYHVATLDHDDEFIFAESADFIAEHLNNAS